MQVSLDNSCIWLYIGCMKEERMERRERREIKFRAWDEKKGRMVNVGEKRMVEDFHSGMEMEVETQSFYILSVYPDTLMQYTGLKDRNGVEIYEGDVVRWWWDHIPEPHYGPNAVVRFGTIYEGDDHDRTGWVVDDCFVDEKCEVIGNIYENANLLREVDDDI